MYLLLTPVAVWGAGQSLNGLLDISHPRVHEARVTGSTMVKTTRYLMIEDWESPGNHVYFYDPENRFGNRPVGSTITLETRSGLFGWEYYTR
jgi:hypothetical protein